MLEQILQEKEINFNSLENFFYRKGCELASNALGDLLQMLDHKLEKERDKSIYRHKGHRKTTIKTLMGEVSFSRAVYQIADDSGEKKFIYLLDEYLKFDFIGLVSSNLAEKVVENACITSYKNAAKNVSELTGQSISHGGAWNIIQKLGKKISEIEEEQTELYKQGKLMGEKEIKVLFEEADGVMLKMRGKDRKKSKMQEMKVSIFHEGWKPVGKNRYELLNKKVICGFDSVKNFTDKKEARISGIYNTDEIEMRIFNSDGAEWIKNLHIDDTTYFQLDKFHVKQAIVRTTREKEIRENISNLYESGRIEEMFEIIEAYANSVSDTKQEEKLRKLYDYLYKNKEGLIAYQKREIGLPKPPNGVLYKSMGACEHNVDLTVARRMKHHGASWSVNGANNLGKLLSLKASTELRKTLNQITKIVLPETVTNDIITVLSAGKTPKTEGKGFQGKTCRRPFDGALRTFGRDIIDSIFDLKEFSEIPIR